MSGSVILTTFYRRDDAKKSGRPVGQVAWDVEMAPFRDGKCSGHGRKGTPLSRCFCLTSLHPRPRQTWFALENGAYATYRDTPTWERFWEKRRKRADRLATIAWRREHRCPTCGGTGLTAPPPKWDAPA